MGASSIRPAGATSAATRRFQTEPRGAALLLLVSLLAPASPAAQELDDVVADLPRVEAIRFEGVRSVKVSSLEKVLKTRTRSWIAFWRERPLLRQDFLRADTRNIELFYARSGLLAARAAARVERPEGSSRTTVIYTVQEGPRTLVRSITWAGNRRFSDERLAKEVLTRAGDPINPVQIELDQDRLAVLYADDGYFPVVDGGWKQEGLAADVGFTIREGPQHRVGTIAIEGVQKVDTFAVRRELLLHPGDVFRRDEVVRSIERLYASSLFQVVDFSPARVDTVGSIVDLLVALRERKHKRVEGGVGISSRDGFRVLGSWSNLNLSGHGNRLNASASVWFSGLGGTETRVSYTEPWILDLRVAAQLGAFLNQAKLNFHDQPYTERNYGPNLSFLREVGRFTRLLLSAEAKWSKALSTPDLPPEELTSFRTDYFTTRLLFTPSYDDRDNKFDARDGQFHIGTVELGNLFSGADDDFYKLVASGAWHVRTGERSSISLRLQAGRMWPFPDATAALAAVPASDLFRTGGSSSVRGYAELELAGADGVGGLVQVISNVEYRFPIAGILSGAVFVDGGNVWARPTDLHLDQLAPARPGTVLDANQMRWSSGGGLRLASPVGPLRLDLGYRLYRDERDLEPDAPSRTAFSFSFGQVF